MSHPTCGPAGNLGDLHITTSTRDEAGSCSFCPTQWPTTSVVHVLEGGRLQIRLCNKCLKQIKAYKP